MTGLNLDLESCQTVQDQYRFILQSIVGVPRSTGPHKIPIVVIRHLLDEAVVAAACECRRHSKIVTDCAWWPAVVADDR